MKDKIELFNNNILVKEIIQGEQQFQAKSGLVLGQNTEDEQVSWGKVIVGLVGSTIQAGDTVLFHKTLPVDVHLKLDGDEMMEQYFFVKELDLICKIRE